MAKKIPAKKGDRYGRLTAMGIAERIYVGYSEKNKYIWKEKCICDCGNVVYISRAKLRCGETKSCGCLQKDITIKRSIIHGDRHTRFYKTRAGIKQRCLNPNDSSYINYGARGISICKERLQYENFKLDMYDDYIKYSNIYGGKNITIDRIDVNGNYCKQNCKRSTRDEQANNKRSNLLLDYKGEKYKSLMLLCKSFGLEDRYESIRKKLKKGQELDLIIGSYNGNCNKS